jgi:hypothetical protein
MWESGNCRAGVFLAYKSKTTIDMAFMVLGGGVWSLVVHPDRHVAQDIRTWWQKMDPRNKSGMTMVVLMYLTTLPPFRHSGAGRIHY